MKLIIIRHGQSEADLLDIHEGRADYKLTELGKQQARALADYISKKYKIDKIYCSTLSRARQTAGYLSEATGVPIILDENLMEFNNGLIAGMDRKEADEKYPEVKGLPSNKAVYEQETKEEFRNRARLVIDRIVYENDDDQTIAVVSHGGMINQLYGFLLGIPVEKRIGFCTDDTGFHIWRLGKGSFVIEKSNSTDHLRRK